MNSLQLSTTCVCILTVWLGFTQAKGWHGVVPLHSTRAEVERLLGAPKESRGVASTYETKEEKFLSFILPVIVRSRDQMAGTSRATRY